MGGTFVAERVEGEVAKQIARVAARLFAERGYDATSVREIVEAAGVTKPTLYYHFGSKEGLAQALLTVPMTALATRLRQCLDATSDPVTNLAAQFDTHFEFIREDPDRARFYYALKFGPHRSSLAEELAGFGRELGATLQEGVDRVVAHGLVDSARAERFATACWGIILVRMMEFLYPQPGCRPTVAAGSPPGQAQTRAMLWDLIEGFAPSRRRESNE
jgi:TetR/AcrR family transcriptional regulator